MIGKALNSKNDIIIEDGSIKRVSDFAETVQHVRTRLLFYRGEWFLNTEAGVPYFDQIFTKPVNLANIESILKTTILTTPGITKLLQFSMDYEGASNRRLSVSFSAETEYGDIDNLKVTINE